MRCYITDSVIGDFNKKDHTYVLPILIQIEDTTYVDDETFDKNILAEALENKKKITTSQPNIGKTIELFEELKTQYTEFVLIHTGSKISGTYATSVSAATQVGLNFIGIDSYGAGPHIEHLLNLAHDHAEEPLEQLQERLEARAKTAGGIIIPGSLERLKLSGRISALQVVIGDLLKITPIFVLKDGELNVLKKERTRKKAYSTMFGYIAEQGGVEQTTVLVYEFPDEELFKTTLNQTETKDLHAALLVHLGKGSIGVLWN